MATIVQPGLERLPSHSWRSLAERAAAWAGAHGVVMRDAVVIVPFVQLLVPARAAWAAAVGPAGWMPRVETTQTLAASLGPTSPAEPDQLGFDAGIDRLVAARLLRGQAWGLAWARRDPRGFEHATAAFVTAAHALGRAAAALAPDLRADHWARARRVLAPTSGPGAEEQWLARVALEWASAAPAPATDRLFALRPSAWIVVQAGGADPLCRSVLDAAEAAATACLWLDTDASDDSPFAQLTAAPALAVCDDFEDEAESAAASVIRHLQAGDAPVALVAEDRLLVRRIRALLARHRVHLHDETGWKLSTTRAAAAVTGLLASSAPDASTDALLDWLKSGTRWSATARDDDAAIAALESLCRRHAWWRVSAIDAPLRRGPLAAWWSGVAGLLAAFAAQPRQPLDAWLAALADALQRSGAWSPLQADDAGRQVIAALRLAPEHRRGEGWRQGAGTTPLTRPEFDAWLRSVLEDESFKPSDRAGGQVQVIVTPLARVMLRPFAALVLPGADDRHLGARASPHPLFSDAQADALGLTTLAARERSGLQAFAHALAVPQVTLLRRRIDGTEPLAASPWLLQLGLALARRGHGFAPWHDPRVLTAWPATPARRSSPSAPGRLPARLSASALEALRACPYRFFALYLLGLRDDDELNGELDKRDFGTWLHAVLHRFHLGRADPASAPQEIARLRELADQARAELGFDAAEFLPFAASFADFAPRYIAWLHGRDEAGAQWQCGEHELTTTPPALGGMALRGVIDRVDALPGATLQLIDYKTGSATDLKAKVAEPLEDTQLAFYAALMMTSQAALQSDASLAAAYLALDGKQGIATIVHPDVAASASALLAGVAVDFTRLRDGAGLPALGAGPTCEHCTARGICRRDDWAEAAA